MKFKQIAATILISGATAFASVFVYNKYLQKPAPIYQSKGIPVNYASYSLGNVNATPPSDFQQAASIAMPTVVHIKTKTNPREVNNNLPRRRNPWADLFGDDLFGDDEGRRYYIPGQMASGSGVLISDDGYIVTNNHVIDDADEITVTLNDRKSYKAKVVGTDPNTDLAVLKINAHGLPYILYGNSDNVNVGQWVLAIGYPLNLETTVTAGIVSAKARSIGINGRQTAIESFIQTDAAVNQGNSGGALINTAGELIGINSAIASPTGAYAGYSYAIPVNIVKKVVNDILKYGTVQRAFLGVNFVPSNLINEEVAQKQGIRMDVEGVYVADVSPNSAAAMAGLKKGDIITKINGVPTPSSPQMVEQVARYKPGDKITISYVRNNKEYTVSTILKNRDGNTDVVKESILDNLGADFVTIPKSDANELGLEGGVLVRNITNGLIRKQTNMRPGFVITKVGKYRVTSVEELRAAVEKQATGNVQIEGIYPGYAGVYYYGLNDINGSGN